MMKGSNAAGLVSARSRDRLVKGGKFELGKMGACSGFFCRHLAFLQGVQAFTSIAQFTWKVWELS
jgi:hypothetical protein